MDALASIVVALWVIVAVVGVCTTVVIYAVWIGGSRRPLATAMPAPRAPLGRVSPTKSRPVTVSEVKHNIVNLRYRINY